MRCLAQAAVFLSLCAIALNEPASAHTRSESHSTWEFSGQRVELVFTAPELEFNRLWPQGSRPSDAAVEDYLAARVFPLAAGARCPTLASPEPLPATAGYRKFHLTFACAGAGGLQIHSDAFFDLIPSHVHLAQIQGASGEFAEQLLSTTRRTAEVSFVSGSPLESAGFWEFVRMGAMHIFTGPDHMAFLLGLVLITRKLRDLVFVITGFTLGHSLTLALATTGVLRPHAEYIDALVALTIALIGAENAALQSGRAKVIGVGIGVFLLAMGACRFSGIGQLPPLLLFGSALFTTCYILFAGERGDLGRMRTVITVVFGLIHGFGFAAGLTEMRLPSAHLLKLLVGFNLGVEAGQLTLILSVIGFAAALARWKLSLPRSLVADLASAFLVGLGLYWFVGRSFG